MSPTAPPIQARAGERRARGSIAPPMPIRADSAASASKALAPSPLRALQFPAILTPPLGLVVRYLDRGRLHAPALVDLLGWTPGLALEADAGRSNRLRLRARVHHEGPVIGGARVHLDGGGRIVVTAGLRTHLGIAHDGQVTAWAERDVTGRPTGVVALASPALLVRALVALAALEDAACADVDDNAGTRRLGAAG